MVDITICKACEGASISKQTPHRNVEEHEPKHGPADPRVAPSTAPHSLERAELRPLRIRVGAAVGALAERLELCQADDDREAVHEAAGTRRIRRVGLWLCLSGCVCSLLKLWVEMGWPAAPGHHGLRQEAEQLRSREKDHCELHEPR